MANPYPNKTGGYVHDANGFFPPSYFGFPAIVDRDLKMSMFPLCDVVTAPSEKTDLRKVVLQMPNIERMLYGIKESMGFDALYRTIVWSTSLGSPPIPKENRNGGYKLDTSIFKTSPGIETPRQWIQKYFVGQLINTFLHQFYQEDYSDVEGRPTLFSGVNYMIDVTEGTLLDEEFSVLEIIRIVYEGFITYSLVETDENKEDSKKLFTDIVGNYYHRINAVLKAHNDELIADEYKEKLWVIFIFLAIKLFQQKEKGYIERVQKGEHMEYVDYDYKLRFYLVKRRGRLVHRTTETAIPPEMYAAHGEENLSESIWLAMSQYYRLLTLVQTAFILPVIKTQIFPLQTFVFRDAHACTSSSISTEYDNIFFSSAMVKNTEENVAMFGINPRYKMKRHARISSNNISWIQDIFEENASGGLSSHSFGVLAGVCWFFNYNPGDNSLFDEKYHNILLIPFNELSVGGLPVNTFYNNEEAENLLSVMPGFFTYGVDEYILSKLVTNAFRDQELWDGVNFLFFTIHFIRDYCGSGSFSEYEYYPLTASFLARDLPKRARSFGRFAKIHFVDEGLKFIFINTMFGNIDNRVLVDIPTKNIVQYPSDKSYNNAYNLFWKILPSVFSDFNNNGNSNTFGEPQTINMSCLLDHLHRYDRPLYWFMRGRNNNNGSYSSVFAPRKWGDDGSLIIPNNRSKYPARDIEFVLENKITDLSCMLGDDCPDNTNSETHMTCLDHSERGLSTWGGSKKKKTRKARNKKRRQTRRK